MDTARNEDLTWVCRILRKEKTLVGQGFSVLLQLKRVMGIEPTLSAWKADIYD